MTRNFTLFGSPIDQNALRSFIIYCLRVRDKESFNVNEKLVNYHICFLCTTGGHNQSIRSNYSDEKFHSSFTEDELKHEFRQVLPSENHRRKSLDRHRDFMVSANEETSSVRVISFIALYVFSTVIFFRSLSIQHSATFIGLRFLSD